MKLINIKNKDLESFFNALNATNQKLATTGTKTPLKFSYAMSRNITFFGKALDAMTDERRDVVKQYAQLDEQGNIKLEEIVVNQEEIDNTPEGEVAPPPMKMNTVVFKEGEGVKDEADDAVGIFLKESREIKVYKFPSLDKWVEDTEEDLDHAATQMIFSVVDLINELENETADEKEA